MQALSAQTFLSANTNHPTPLRWRRLGVLMGTDNAELLSHASEQSVACRQRLFPLHSAVPSADLPARGLIPPGLPPTHAKSWIRQLHVNAYFLEVSSLGFWIGSTKAFIVLAVTLKSIRSIGRGY